MTLMFILLTAMLWFVAAPVVTYFLCVLVVLLASACFEWQIVRPIENVARQALKVAVSKINIRVITPRARQRSGNEGSLP
ncbi:hypothetical protein ACUOA8_59195, partial [Escherichia sp. SS-MK2]